MVVDFSKIGTVDIKFSTVQTKINTIYPKFGKKTDSVMSDFFSLHQFFKQWLAPLQLVRLEALVQQQSR
jgi:hypothetical protein